MKAEYFQVKLHYPPGFSHNSIYFKKEWKEYQNNI
jgi:hypothetical protein